MTKKFEILEIQHDMTSSAVLNTVSSIEGIEMHIHLDRLMKQRNLSQRDVAKITGLRVGTVNNIINNKGTTLNKVQLIALMVGLRITDLSELLEIKFPNHIVNQFKHESEEWTYSKMLPSGVRELAMQNTILSLSDKKQKEADY